MARTNSRRDSNGRFTTDHRTRNLAIGAATAIGVVGAAVAGALRYGLLDRLFPASEGHEAPDLALDADRPGADDRAPEAFRPDPTAIPTAAERESLRVPDGVDKGFTADTRSDELTPA